eukprot:CAMPEP_0180636576 /NCGR_PEP_ID=MMETSP1037_2-20121125/43231_1 /TAXON_ID=632150 /ORGANISM="Azadinium spinosum, Strain 3D9" /LENGTH=47 /DNA_ID= /DNA_START= /DNA_END= /DNA_ORIENTATION=
MPLLQTLQRLEGFCAIVVEVDVAGYAFSLSQGYEASQEEGDALESRH